MKKMYKKFAKKYHITEKQVKEMVKEINVYKCSGVNPILYINDPVHLELYKVMLKKKKKDKKKHIKEELLSEEEPCTSTAIAVCLFLITYTVVPWTGFPHFILLCMA